MGMNRRYAEKFEKAYAGLPRIEPPVIFMEGSPHYHQEVWKDVLPMYVPGVMPNTYKISTHGQVYSGLRSPNYPNGSIMKHSINAKGYHQINLMSTDHRKIGIKITKLMMLHFCFEPGCYNYEIDHLDGNKDHNFIWNLQWVTPQENVHRAIMNRQRTASNHSNTYDVLTDQQAVELYNRAKALYSGEVLGEDDEELAAEYGVTVEYIDGLVNGRIRPYIANRTNYKFNHRGDLEYSIKNFYVDYQSIQDDKSII